MEDNYPFSVLKEAIARKVSPHAMWLLTYYITNPGESFKFHQSYILFLTGWGNKTYLKYRKELIEKGFITSEYARENGKRAGSYVTVNRTFSKVSDVNVSDKHLSTSKVSKGNVTKGNVTKGNVTKGNVTERHDIREKVERKRINKREEVETHASAPAGAAASVCVPPQPASITPKTETVPPEEQTSPVRPRNRKQTVPVSENPPSLEDIKAYIPEVLRGKGITGWTEQDIHSTAYDIWNRYTNNRWTTAKGDPMYSWENAVTGWILRNNGIPQRMAPVNQQQGQPQNGKSFKQQERDYANRYLIDPIGTAISDCVNQSIIAGGDPCDWGLAPQFHDEAMKLMETRKEQALSGHTPAAPIDIFGIGFGGKE